ncbi:MAG TPA: SulP family inorganic anion transporter [Urbifossiella sp.]|nr:SulP family inorganic anion transporter [Urbifossiella sp.]
MATHAPSPGPPPIAPGRFGTLRFDLLSGFLVFLIAMPLCLGIAKASEYPPIAGIWTAVIGGILTTFISNSQMTIKGPAAGLIVVAAGSVVSLGEHAVPAHTGAQVADLRAQGKSADEVAALKTARAAEQIKAGYPLALGCALVAGVIQILFGLFKAGALGEMVPLTPVHGMLASIGITIMAKQTFPMLGVPNPPSGWSPVHVIASIPAALEDINGMVAAVGLVSLAILIAFQYAKAAVPAIRSVPAQVVVLAVAIPLGAALGLAAVGKDVGVATLVSVPNIVYGDDPREALAGAFAWPKFDAVASGPGVVAVLMFCLIASIESMLSSQAIDMIDPWRRKTDQNRGLLATGVGNTLCAAVGALPMISEIVRSKANIDNGARTRLANGFHGLFLLAFVLLLPMVINVIPVAALGAMLVFVGFRLASPKEFINTYKIGAGQLVVFVTTVAVTLSTDLLVGVVSGVALEAVLHVVNGAPLRSLFLMRADIEIAAAEGDRRVVLVVKNAAIFSNWLALRGAILKNADGRDEVVLDLARVRLVDHSVMEKLHELGRSFADLGKTLSVVGLDKLAPASNHPLAARKGAGRGPGPVPAGTGARPAP